MQSYRTFQTFALGLLFPALALFSASASAVPLDVTEVTDAITLAAGAGATIGMAVVVMIVGIKLFKWVRRAL